MVKQVGGDHYAGEYQHWDWVDDLGLGYLKGYATKYIFRHEDKNGREDLEKTLSCLEKLKTANELSRRHPNFEAAQKLTGYLGMIPQKREVFVSIAMAQNIAMVGKSIQLVQDMIDEHYPVYRKTEAIFDLTGLVFQSHDDNTKTIFKDGESIVLDPVGRLPKLLTQDQMAAFGNLKFRDIGLVHNLYSEIESEGTPQYIMIQTFVADFGYVE